LNFSLLKIAKFWRSIYNTLCYYFIWVIDMDLHNWGKLLVTIELKRRELYEVSKNEPHNKQKLTQISQRLDTLVNTYQQTKTPLCKDLYPSLSNAPKRSIGAFCSKYEYSKQVKHSPPR